MINAFIKVCDVRIKMTSDPAATAYNATECVTKWNRPIFRKEWEGKYACIKI